MISYVKRKMSVYKIKIRRKFIIQTIEDWKDIIQMIVSVNYETFDLHMLLGDEMTSGYVIRSSLLGIITK